MAIGSKKSLRSDIQALRAVAVLLVIAYHYNLGPLKGGFLGVDIFFVISGYVITQRLAGYTGRFRENIHDFYLKRARRLLPSSLLVITTTAIASRILLPAISLNQIAKEALAATVFLPNLYFAHEQNNYMNQGLDPSPYLHFWSLGVEEQFYLVWPILFLLCFRKRLRWTVIALPITLGLSLIMTQQNALTAFYQPWTRAWEFLVGAVLIYLPKMSSRLLHISLATLGWGGIGASALLISSTHPTPGLTTLVPVASAALIIAAALPITARTRLPYLGDISYSLYLVHWPLFVILTSRYTSSTTVERLLMALSSIAIAALIYNYFENPLRTTKGLRNLWQFAIGLLVAGAISFFTLTTGVQASGGAITISRAEPILYADGCHLLPPEAAIPKPNCFFGDTSSKTLVILVGDSHAAMHFPGLNLLAQHNHWKLLALTKSSCPAAILPIVRAGVPDRACIAWQKNLAKVFQNYRAKYIFLAGATEQSYQLSDTSKPYSIIYADGFTKVLNEVIASGAKPVLLSDTPWPGKDSPSCILKNKNHLSRCDLPLPHSLTTTSVKSVARSRGAIVIDSSADICTRGECPAVFNNTNVYRDYSHISVATSLRLAPFYARALGVNP
jgi:peptidoglycan/LPS O-acetylase OafA/YrhL